MDQVQGRSEGSRAAPEDGEISLIDIFATLIRHRKLIIAVTAGATALSVIFTLGSLLLPPQKNYLPNIYKATALMLVNNQDSTGGLSTMLASSGLSGLAGMAGVSVGSTSYGDLAVAIAKSNTILDELIGKFGLVERYGIKRTPKSDSRKATSKRLSVSYEEKTGILTLSFEDWDPVLGRDLVNEAVALLDQRFTTIGGNRDMLKRDQLESKLADVKIEMTRIEGEIQAFQRKHGVITVESAATEQISTVAQVRSQLMMKEMEIKTYGDVSRVYDPALLRLKAERDNLSKLLGELEKGFSEYEGSLPSQRELPRLAIEFGHLQRDLAVQEKIFELLTQQLELTKLQIAGTDPIIQILEPAEAPDKKSGPSRSLICIVTAFTSFLVSALAALIIEVVGNLKADPIIRAKLRGEPN
jgi:tyrosine-protein kinase Etk/Wzc